MELISALIGALIGGAMTFLSEFIFRRKNKKENESHFSSILYYDLKSIENFVTSERSSVDIRYSPQWQDLISNCSFLTDSQVKHLYNVYDSVYNFDYFYKNKDSNKLTKEDCLKNSQLSNHINNENFKSVIQILKKYIV